MLRRMLGNVSCGFKSKGTCKNLPCKHEFGRCFFFSFPKSKIGIQDPTLDEEKCELMGDNSPSAKRLVHCWITHLRSSGICLPLAHE